MINCIYLLEYKMICIVERLALLCKWSRLQVKGNGDCGHTSNTLSYILTTNLISWHKSLNKLFLYSKLSKLNIKKNKTKILFFFLGLYKKSLMVYYKLIVL